jgi:hypothetical protein
MSANQKLFMFDHCYSRPGTMLEASFNATLLKSYNKYLTPNVNECEKKALRNNSDFFLINDVSSIGARTYTNCYLPKSNSSGSSVIGANSVINRALVLFNTTFGNAPYTKQSNDTIDLCSNFLYNSGPNNPNKCFEYTVDNKVYAPRRYYAYYKKPIINVNNIDIATRLQNPQVYKNEIAKLKGYETLIKIDHTNYTANGPLVYAFNQYICDPIQSKERALDAQIKVLRDKYEYLFTSLDTISADISSINYLNSFDNETIISLNVRIKERTKELNSLLGFGGANNGRLSDTTFLTQFKIVESSILLLIIITVLFLYNKMKKIK